MIYTLEINELLNKNNDVIGAEAMVFLRTNDGEIKDCLSEKEVFVNGNDLDNVEDRNFLIEDEFNIYQEACNSFEWESNTLKNYLT